MSNRFNIEIRKPCENADCNQAIVGYFTKEQCPKCWLRINQNKEQKTLVKISLPVRTNKCEFLETRVEFRQGCGGWKCRHKCNKGLPAVPGDYCQTCVEYVDSGEKF